MISAEMIAPLLEQLTAGAEASQAEAGEFPEGSGGREFYFGRAAGLVNAVVLVSTWAAGVQS